MDIQIPFIFVFLFSLASVVLIFIYKFGIKEKSYEEALAEQRQQTHILLGVKSKLKEKKNKKPSKKVQSVAKEKLTVQENEVSNEAEQIESNQKHVEGHKKLHVEFKEDAEDVSTKTTNKKQPKKDKVRPILVRKESFENELEKSPNTDSAACPANHFEEIHPKDDFELFRSVSGEDVTTDEPEKNGISSVESESPKLNHNKKVEAETAVKKENVPALAASSINGVIGNSGKEKKKKKSEFNHLQQLAGDANGPNMSVLLNLVRKAELSRSEVQVLIDLLLNKQHEAPAIVDEWSEGKSDPVQKLKKQLAEKEKLLSEEQQVVAGAQAKLREIRSEHQSEKSALLQKIRNMEEMIHTKQLEASRNHQQVQQLQTQVKEEVVKYHNLRDEHAALQMQRQQFEMRLSQAQESEVIINQLQNEVQEISAISNKLRMELTHFKEENNTEKERNQTLIVQLNNFQQELEQKTDRNRQLEEMRLQLERDMETILKQENDLKGESSRLNSVIQQQNEEIRRLEHVTKQYHEDLQKHKEESNKLINQLTVDLRHTQEENVQMKVTHMNGSMQENKQHEVEILNLHNELSSVKTQLSQVERRSEQELKSANASVERLEKEIGELEVKLNEERSKLEEQKTKNNELRERNWKVMEALNAAESRLKTSTSDVRTKSEDEIQREFIERLFPEIKDREITDAHLFRTEGEKFVRKYIESLQSSQGDTTQLKVQLEHYKTAIDNTEKMLNKLQEHIEQEETNWKMQLTAKAAELEAVKQRHREELQEKLVWLETELRKDQVDAEGIITQFQQNKNDAHAQSLH